MCQKGNHKNKKEDNNNDKYGKIENFLNAQHPGGWYLMATRFRGQY